MRFVSFYTTAVSGGELLSGDSPDRPFQVSVLMCFFALKMLPINIVFPSLSGLIAF
jgi:hypothetical protein